ncbi:MAG: hypothetical protein KAR83_08740 [Thermodesulfovibrionales bacterium]|nr:hypothetical protein [Thermodesulfovibrionales bacterium]
MREVLKSMDGQLTQLPKIAPIVTGDGSASFYNNQVGETYHSRSGAAREAIEKFCRPSGLGRLAGQGRAVIYDICFGLGYNTAAALDMILECNPECLVDVYGFELDPSILEMTGQVTPPFNSYPLVREASKNLDATFGSASIKIFLGDVRQELDKAPRPADVVFFDPFSPCKEPELWSRELFRAIHSRMHPGAVLTTYSCASKVRQALDEAGFEVADGPCVGQRSTSTVAYRP